MTQPTLSHTHTHTPNTEEKQRQAVQKQWKTLSGIVPECQKSDLDINLRTPSQGNIREDEETLKRVVNTSQLMEALAIHRKHGHPKTWPPAQ